MNSLVPLELCWLLHIASTHFTTGLLVLASVVTVQAIPLEPSLTHIVKAQNITESLMPRWTWKEYGRCRRCWNAQGKARTRNPDGCEWPWSKHPCQCEIHHCPYKKDVWWPGQKVDHDKKQSSSSRVCSQWFYARALTLTLSDVL